MKTKKAVVDKKDCSRSHGRCSRRSPGFALMLVLVMMSIATVVLLGGVRLSALAASEQLRADRQMQARWWMSSALSFARAKVEAGSEFESVDLRLPDVERVAMDIKLERVTAASIVEANVLFPINSPRAVRMQRLVRLEDREG